VHDAADDQMKPGRPECLAVLGPIKNPAALMEEDSPLELVGRFTLVATGLNGPCQWSSFNQRKDLPHNP
jgi:hypothetical protein